MNDLSGRIGLLGGIVAFSAAMLVGLLRDCPPLQTAKKALICAVLLAVVARLGARLALGVVREGIRQYNREKRQSR